MTSATVSASSSASSGHVSSSDMTTALPSDLSNLKITPPKAGFGVLLPSSSREEVNLAQASNFFNLTGLNLPPNAADRSGSLVSYQETCPTVILPPALSLSPQSQDSGQLPDYSPFEEVAHQCLVSYEKAFTFACKHGYPSAPIVSYDNIIKGHHVHFNQLAAMPHASGNSPNMIKMAMMQRMTGVIEKVVKFCKGVPGFKSLSMNDQMLILKAAAFEIIALNSANVVDLSNKTMTFLGDPHYVVPFEMLMMTPFGSLLNEFKHIGSKLTSMRINPTELSMLCAVILLSPGMCL